ncbi:hypothetical protein Tco_0671158 [Tanacetum coccineum]
MTHPSPKRKMVPKAALMRSGLVSLTVARPVNTATQNNSEYGKNVNTARPKAVDNAARPKVVLNAVKENQVNAVKASACWVQKLKTKVLDHVSKHNSASTILKRAIDMENHLMVMQGWEGRDIWLPLWPTDLPFSQNLKSSPDAGFKPSVDNQNKVTKEPGKESNDSNNDQEKEDDNVNNTNNVNTTSDGNNTNNVNAVSPTVNYAGIEVNAVGAKTSIELPVDPNMLELEDNVLLDDDKGCLVHRLDINNFEYISAFSPI